MVGAQLAFASAAMTLDQVFKRERRGLPQVLKFVLAHVLGFPGVQMRRHARKVVGFEKPTKFLNFLQVIQVFVVETCSFAIAFEARRPGG